MTKVLSSIKLPVATQANVESGTWPAGSIYYDSGTSDIRFYDGTSWASLGSGSTVDMPIGSIQPWLGATAPSGWLICNGQAVSRTTYSGLYTIISTRFGSGDGTTTFNVPDLQGYQITGAGSALGNVDNTTTFRQGTNNADTIATHSPSAAQHSHFFTYTAFTETQHNFDHTHSATVSEGTVTLNAHTYSDTSNFGQDHTHTASVAAGASVSVTGTGNTRSSAAHTHGAAPSVDGGGTNGGHQHTISTSSWSAHSAHRHSPVYSLSTTANTSSASPTTHNHTATPSTDGNHTHTGHEYKTYMVHYIIKAV